MTVLKSQRTEGKLQVLVKAKDLAAYTVQITKNEQIFPKRNRWLLTSHIVDESLQIFGDIRKGNSINVRTHADFSQRRSLQLSAYGRCECLRNVGWKDSVSGYAINGLKNTSRLRNELLTGRYRISQYQRFRITEPKEREILATRIKDRQFQRSLCDNIVYPALTRSFIRANCACQRGRGTYDALKLMREIVIDCGRRFGRDAWVLKCDVKKFFPSTKHSVAQAALGRYIDDQSALQHARDIISSFSEAPLAGALIEDGMDAKSAGAKAHKIVSDRIYGGARESDDGIGIGLGSQVSQLTQLALLDPMDHYIKERLRVRHYVRYMDDFVLIHEDRAYLEKCLREIRRILSELGLELNPKTEIFKISRGINFLHWRFFLTDSGKTVMRKSAEKISKQRKKMRKFKNMLDDGRMNISDIRSNFQSWQSGLIKFGCFGIVNEMREFYYQLFGERAPRWKKIKH